VRVVQRDLSGRKSARHADLCTGKSWFFYFFKLSFSFTVLCGVLCPLLFSFSFLLGTYFARLQSSCRLSLARRQYLIRKERLVHRRKDEGAGEQSDQLLLSTAKGLDVLGLDPVLPDTQKEKIKPRTGKEEERQRKEGRAKRDLPSTTTTPTEERDGEKPAQEETSSSGSAMQQDSHPPISSPRETMEVDVELEESEGGGSGGGGSVGGLRIAEEGEIHDDEEEEDNEFEEDEEEDTEEESDARIRRLLEEIAEGMLCICPNLDICSVSSFFRPWTAC